MKRLIIVCFFFAGLNAMDGRPPTPGAVAGVADALYRVMLDEPDTPRDVESKSASGKESDGDVSLSDEEIYEDQFPLHHAIRTGKNARAVHLLNQSIDVAETINEVDQEDHTTLDVALIALNEEMIDVLLELGAITTDFFLSSYEACGNQAIVDLVNRYIE